MQSTRIPAGVAAEAVTIPGAGGATLFGIVSRPPAGARGSTAFVMIGKTGPGDVWRAVAEALAREGHLVLRFEPAGLGDSPGGDPSADMPVLTYYRGVQEGVYAEDTAEAVRWVRRTYEPAAVYVIGICANCSAALLAAAALGEAVAGVVLVTPPVLYVNPGPVLRSQDAKALGRGYTRRILDPAAYRSLLTGKSDYRAIWNVALWLARRPGALVRRLLARLDRRPRPTHPDFNWRFWEGFRGMMEQGQPVLSLLAEFDGDTGDFNAELKRAVIDRSPRYARLCAVQLLEKTDHAFLLDDSPQRAVDAILAWLRARQGPRQTAVRASSARISPAASRAMSMPA